MPELVVSITCRFIKKLFQTAWFRGLAEQRTGLFCEQIKITNSASFTHFRQSSTSGCGVRGSLWGGQSSLEGRKGWKLPSQTPQPKREQEDTKSCKSGVNVNQNKEDFYIWIELDIKAVGSWIQTELWEELGDIRDEEL